MRIRGTERLGNRLGVTELVSWRNQDSNPRLPPQASRRALLPSAECSRALAKLWLLFPLRQPSRVGVATGEQADAQEGRAGCPGCGRAGIRTQVKAAELRKTENDQQGHDALHSPVPVLECLVSPPWNALTSWEAGHGVSPVLPPNLAGFGHEQTVPGEPLERCDVSETAPAAHAGFSRPR